MGELMLETVLGQLRDAGFRAELAYPGRRIPEIREIVAAVHIQKADPVQASLTVAVTILAPEAEGGTACELEALRAMEALCRGGAVCTQNGCAYDSLGRVYSVTILAEYTGFLWETPCALGKGIRLSIGDEVVEYAVSFAMEKTSDPKWLQEMGSEVPVDTLWGIWVWKLRLEELLPMASIGASQPTENFTLRIQGETGTETYTGCCWTSVSYEYTPRGVRRIRTGYAIHKEA